MPVARQIEYGERLTRHGLRNHTHRVLKQVPKRQIAGDALVKRDTVAGELLQAHIGALRQRLAEPAHPTILVALPTNESGNIARRVLGERDTCSSRVEVLLALLAHEADG